MISDLGWLPACRAGAELSYHPLLREDCPLFLVQGSGLLFWKPKWSVDRIEVLPTIPTDFARAKGWCLNKIPSFGAALGLSATSISSAWGTAWKEMAREAHWCLCTPALWEGAGGRLAAAALGAEKEQRNAVSQGYMACQSQSPRVAFASVLPLKRGLSVQPLLCLLAPGTGDGLHSTLPTHKLPG